MPVSNDVQQEIISAYQANSALYAEYAQIVNGLIKAVLESHSLSIHSVVCRPKSIKSLAEKITRPDKAYAALSDITDLAGARITTYFADDVDRVADALRLEFSLDERASIDKRLYADPDRFGYQSLHYVVSLHPSRATLAEYAKFAKLKCEVQVRSILQHAWAEIEHDLGYKSAVGVPFDLRRRFARIAGLFELADDEFHAIRDALKGYEKALPKKIRDAPSTVDLDLPSFRALFSLPSAITSLDDAVIRAASGTLTHKNIRGLDSLIERLHSFEIYTVQQLENIAIDEMANVGAFAKYWSAKPLGNVDAGIGIFYLIYVLSWKLLNRDQILSYLNKYNIGLEQDRESMVERILAFPGA